MARNVNEGPIEVFDKKKGPLPCGFMVRRVMIPDGRVMRMLMGDHGITLAKTLSDIIRIQEGLNPKVDDCCEPSTQLRPKP